MIANRYKTEYIHEDIELPAVSTHFAGGPQDLALLDPITVMSPPFIMSVPPR